MFLKQLLLKQFVSQKQLSLAWMIQQLEGQDIQRIAKGTSSAQQLTLSFWVKSNLTGTYTILVFDNDNSRSVSAAYTISASATWEKKTITFPADTTGAFDNDNNASMGLYFTLATGTAMTSGTLNTVWGADVEANRCVGQVNLAGTLNNYWQITGVQLEVGPVASSFEFKPFGQELRECQRYYYLYTSGTVDFQQHALGGGSNTGTFVSIGLPTTMRVNPTTALATTSAGNYGRIVGYDTSWGLATATVSGIDIVNPGKNNQQIDLLLTHASMAGTYVHRSFDTIGSTGVVIGLTAEL
jgi:hypothetical protein